MSEPSQTTPVENQTPRGEQKEFAFPKKITVATPMYGGQCNVDYLNGMMDLNILCAQKGIHLARDFISNESLITRARNTQVANFLNSDSEYLIFIDADIGFNANFVFDCLRSGHEVCGVAYPMKNFSSEKFAREVGELKRLKDEGKKGSEISFETLLARTLLPAMNPISRRNENGATEVAMNFVGPFMEVAKLGTGFLCIQRSVLERMIKQYPESYRNDVGGYNNDLVYHTLFNTEVEDGRFLSEDYAFCSKWRKMGGKIFVHLFSRLQHTGFYRFDGNLLDSMDHELRNYILSQLRPEENKDSSPPEPTPTKFSKRKVKKIEELNS